MGLLSSTTNHFHHTSEPYAKEVTINEHRAPTDDSIKLLNEFTEKAQKNIIHSVRVDANHLRAIAIYYSDNIIEDRIHFHIKFSLNEKEFIIKDYIDNSEWREEYGKLYYGFGLKSIYMLVKKKFSEMIAEELMNQSPDFVNSLQNKNALL